MIVCLIRKKQIGEMMKSSKNTPEQLRALPRGTKCSADLKLDDKMLDNGNSVKG